MFLVGGFDELVHEPGGEGVSDAVALLGGGGAERDEQVGLAGAGAPDQAQRVAAADPVAGGELVDGGRVDVGVRGEVEVGEPFLAGEAGALDAAQGGAAVAVVDLGEQEFGEEALVGELLVSGDTDCFVHDRADRG